MKKQKTSVAEYVEKSLEFAGCTEALRDEVLLGQECGNCGHIAMTPKAVCTTCGNTALEPIRLPTEGVVFSESSVSVAPKGFELGYQLALIELRDTGGARLLAQTDGGADIGDEIELMGVFEAGDAPCPIFGQSVSPNSRPDG